MCRGWTLKHFFFVDIFVCVCVHPCIPLISPRSPFGGFTVRGVGKDTRLPTLPTRQQTCSRHCSVHEPRPTLARFLSRVVNVFCVCLFVSFFGQPWKKKEEEKEEKKSFELLCFSLTHAALSFCLFETIYSYSREKGGGGYEKKNVIRRRSLTTPPLTFVCFDFFLLFSCSTFRVSSWKTERRESQLRVFLNYNFHVFFFFNRTVAWIVRCVCLVRWNLRGFINPPWQCITTLKRYVSRASVVMSSFHRSHLPVLRRRRTRLPQPFQLFHQSSPRFPSVFWKTCRKARMPILPYKGISLETSVWKTNEILSIQNLDSPKKKIAAILVRRLRHEERRWPLRR